MHACGNTSSTETLCGIPVDPKGIDVVVGYTSVCRQCFPEKPGTGEGDHIEGRG